MQITRKVFISGNSKAVTLPADWCRIMEFVHNQPLTEVTMTINGSIVIEPRIKEE